MTLADLIDQLNKLPPTMIVGLGRPRSYRGHFDQLAFARVPGATAHQMMREAEDAVGATFEGYKGGSYVMSLDTQCWLAEWGEGGEPLKREHLFAVVPGDGYGVDPLIKLGERLERIPESERTSDQQRHLATIKEAARLRSVATEVADNPDTLVDESRRPLLNGGDYLEQQRKESCDAAMAFALKLAEKFGHAVAEVALSAAVAAIKR